MGDRRDGGRGAGSDRMERVRLGVVGCGVIGQKHLAAAAGLDDVSVVAVADLRSEVARAVAARHGVPAVYADADALFGDREVEGVVLALPTAERTALALRAFAAGKHVLTEKPVAMDAAEVRQLIAARGDRVAGCCSSRLRLLPSAEAAAAFLATGTLGTIRVVRCRATLGAAPPASMPPPAWRLSKALNGGGILANWGCYDLDYLLGILGWSLAPATVLAQTWGVVKAYRRCVAPGSDAETHVAALIRCAGGAAITYERGELLTIDTRTDWEITGERGTLRVQMTPARGKTVYHDAPTPGGVGVDTRVLWEGDEDWDMVHTGLIRDFAGAIREGRPPRTCLDRALVVQEVIDAIYASTEAGEAVTLATGAGRSTR